MKTLTLEDYASTNTPNIDGMFVSSVVCVTVCIDAASVKHKVMLSYVHDSQQLLTIYTIDHCRYQVIYQCGVLISRSSTVLFHIKHFWIFSVLQVHTLYDSLCIVLLYCVLCSTITLLCIV